MRVGGWEVGEGEEDMVVLGVCSVGCREGWDTDAQQKDKRRCYLGAGVDGEGVAAGTIESGVAVVLWRCWLLPKLACSALGSLQNVGMFWVEWRKRLVFYGGN